MLKLSIIILLTNDQVVILKVDFLEEVVAVGNKTEKASDAHDVVGGSEQRFQATECQVDRSSKGDQRPNRLMRIDQGIGP